MSQENSPLFLKVSAPRRKYNNTCTHLLKTNAYYLQMRAANYSSQPNLSHLAKCQQKIILKRQKEEKISHCLVNKKTAFFSPHLSILTSIFSLASIVNMPIPFFFKGYKNKTIQDKSMPSIYGWKRLKERYQLKYFFGGAKDLSICLSRFHSS